MHEYREALFRMRRGQTDRQISRDGVMGRRKAGQLRGIAEQEGWLDEASALPEEAQVLQAIEAREQARTVNHAVGNVSTVAAFTELIDRWYDQGIGGVAIHNALVRNHGYTGHYSSVRRHLSKLKALNITPTMILDFAPGEAAQIDFGAGPMILDRASGGLVKTWFFVMTLCFSRHQYVEFVLDQTVATWLICHHRALRHFGGVPTRLIIDNAKCAITRAVVDDPQVQRAYAECAQGFGFLVSPCPPGDPAKKGRVERGVAFVKGNFLPLRTFTDLSDLNGQAHRWVMHEAGLRIHGTTRETPLSLFDTERAHLQPLPDRAPDVCTWARAKVHRDCHIQFDRCLYSVPFALIGTEVMVRATAGLVQAFDLQYQLVATHLRGTRPGMRRTIDDHLPPAAQAWKMRTPTFCLERAQAVGTACLALVTRMFGDRVLDRLRNVQSLLRLADTFGAERLEAACQRMGEVDIVSARTVRAMLDKGLDQLPISPAPMPISAVYQGKSRFSRSQPATTNSTLQ